MKCAYSWRWSGVMRRIVLESPSLCLLDKQCCSAGHCPLSSSTHLSSWHQELASVAQHFVQLICLIKMTLLHSMWAVPLVMECVIDFPFKFVVEHQQTAESLFWKWVGIVGVNINKDEWSWMSLDERLSQSVYGVAAEIGHNRNHMPFHSCILQ